MEAKTLLKKVKEKGIKGCAESLKGHSANIINALIYHYWSKKPIDNSLIVMESGGEITDNVYALYDYLGRCGYLKKYRVVWLVYEIDGPKEEHKIQHLYSNTKIVWGKTAGVNKEWDKYFATCKWYIYDHTNFKRNFAKRNDQKIINLWHGCAFKRIKAAPPVGKAPADINFITGKVFIPVQCDAFSCSEDKLLDLGYPRNDYLLMNINEDQNSFSKHFHLNQYQKTFLWMPTFRRSINKSLDESYFNSQTGLPIVGDKDTLADFDCFLRQINCFLIFKVHHLQAGLKAFKKDYSNIILLHDEDIFKYNLQLYQIVPLFDALITDYSSIANDFILLDRPIIYTVDDYDQYRDSRGFIPEDPIKYFAGDIVKNYSQFKESIQRIADGKDIYKVKRNKILPLVQSHIDSNNCKRIVEYLGL